MFVYRQSDKNRLVIEEHTQRLRRFTELEKEKERTRIAAEKEEQTKRAEAIAEVEEKDGRNERNGPEEVGQGEQEPPTAQSILRQVFDLVDEDSSGSLTATEIINAVRRDEKGIAGLLQQVPNLSKFANAHLMRGVFDSLGRSASTASLTFEDFEQHMLAAVVTAERQKAAEGAFQDCNLQRARSLQHM